FKIIGKPNKLDYSSLKSFRPISLVSNLSKILEKIILSRLLWLANSNDWFSSDQHGFREGKSTETTRHSLVSFIETAFSDKQSCATAFLDIQSAFDSAWHPAIISPLSEKGCPSPLLHLIHSFLSDRQVILTVEGFSLTKPVRLGCPQGGVLSPFLWNVLIDNLLRPHSSSPVKIIAYADDITIALRHKDPMLATRFLQEACDRTALWLESLKISLNALKSVFVLFAPRLSPNFDLSITINDVLVFPSTSRPSQLSR
ncbi:Uncharacterized protein APZ42_001392, partial [Daphnia magna]